MYFSKFRRLILMCRIVLTFVIMKGSGAVVPVAAEPGGSLAEPKGAQRSGRKMVTPQRRGASQVFAQAELSPAEQRCDPDSEGPASRGLVCLCFCIAFRLGVEKASCRSCHTILPLFSRTTCVVRGSSHHIAFVWGSHTDATYGEHPPAILLFFPVVNTFLWVKHLLFL